MNHYGRILNVTRATVNLHKLNNVSRQRGALWTNTTHRKFHFSCQRRGKSAETELVKQLAARIRFNGPITIADYMREVLTNPVAGYYMHKDVFGTEGDFITSPEISQMFGELLGIWCLHEWMEAGSPPSVQLVELGPGRGTLTDDILRCFEKFPAMKDSVSVHLVEVSPKLSEMQRQKLTGSRTSSSPNTHSDSHTSSSSVSSSTDTHTTAELNTPDRTQETPGESPQHCSQTEASPGDSPLYYKTCHSRYGPDVFWYHQLKDVPPSYSFYIAHEFFDALPIHKFQKRDGRWHEVLVHLDESDDGPHHLQMVLSPQPTVASSLLFQVDPADKREHIEVSPESAIVMQELAERVRRDGGAALIADYGHSAEKEDTFRAFRDHLLWDPLSEPGKADLTADVDFSYLKKMAGNGVSFFGPVTQDSFLHNMGLGVRLQILLQHASAEERKDLITGYDMLTNPEKMGERFKFLAMTQPRDEKTIPAGFKTLS